MRIESDSRLLKIGRREFVELPDGYGDTVRCVAGSLWITEHGSGADCVLGPGQSLRLAGRHRVLVQGLQASTLTLTREARGALTARRIRHVLASWLEALNPLHHHGLRG